MALEHDIFNVLYFITIFCRVCVCVGFGCLHSSTHVSRDEDGILPGRPLHAQPDEIRQGDSWRIGGNVWTDARYMAPSYVFVGLCLWLMTLKEMWASCRKPL